MQQVEAASEAQMPWVEQVQTQATDGPESNCK